MASLVPRSSSLPRISKQDPFPFQPLPRQLSLRQSPDLRRQETDTQCPTDSEFQINFLPITTSSDITPSLAQPILIPTTPANRRDPDRVPTPVSGRGDKKGHLFPVKGTSPTRLSHYSTAQEDLAQTPSPPSFDHTYHHRTFSLTLSPRSRPLAMMHSDRASSRYIPTSPLSPRLQGVARPISPKPSRPRSITSRPMNIPIPNLHPLHFQQRDTTSSSPSPLPPQKPIINYTKHSSTSESPRLMKERQRDLIRNADMSSRIAASPYGVKPDAPRLDPRGSPKGPVTPLALEEGSDYFFVAGSGENSPASSPASWSEGSVKDAGDFARVRKTFKKDGGRR